VRWRCLFISLCSTAISRPRCHRKAMESGLLNGAVLEKMLVFCTSSAGL